MTEPLAPRLDSLADQLRAVPPDADPLQRVELLATAHRALGEVLDEAMAQASIAGVSMRTIASAAGLAPNSVPPRLARARSLAPYVQPDVGKVTIEDVARARHDYRAGSPLRFTPRKPRSSS